MLLRRVLAPLVVLFCLSSLLVDPAAAQGQTPVNVGENVFGELSQTQPAATFVLSNTQPQVVSVQVLALTEGFAPAFSILTPAGIVAQANANQAGSNIIQSAVTLSEVGVYSIQIQRASASFGQFVLSIQSGNALAPAVPIQLGQVVTETVDTQTPLRSYTFDAALAEITSIAVQIPADALSGPLVTLKDVDTSEVLAVLSARVLGASLRLPPGPQRYELLIAHSGGAAGESYSLCVGTEAGSAPCPNASVAVVETAEPAPPGQPTIAPVVIPPSGPCQVTPGSGAVNIRSIPSTDGAILNVLRLGSLAPVIGRLADNTWLQVNVGGVIGWVAARVVIIGGNCGVIPVIVPPTATATSPGPTLTPTSTASATATQTATVTLTPAPVATLNFSLPPVYGTTALTSGFVPDPFTVGITAGGPANVNYLGGGCTGYATSAPSFSVNYTSGAFPTLRFYFIGSGDTTMIINTPSGSYVCVDDSFGTLNPTIDFNSPSTGRYDVWIGSFASGSSIGGTLYVTENTGNHP